MQRMPVRRLISIHRSRSCACNSTMFLQLVIIIHKYKLNCVIPRANYYFVTLFYTHSKHCSIGIFPINKIFRIVKMKKRNLINKINYHLLFLNDS